MDKNKKQAGKPEINSEIQDNSPEIADELEDVVDNPETYIC